MVVVMSTPENLGSSILATVSNESPNRKSA
jgi:hypothetical protein